MRKKGGRHEGRAMEQHIVSERRFGMKEKLFGRRTALKEEGFALASAYNNFACDVFDRDISTAAEDTIIPILVRAIELLDGTINCGSRTSTVTAETQLHAKFGQDEMRAKRSCLNNLGCALLQIGRHRDGMKRIASAACLSSNKISESIFRMNLISSQLIRCARITKYDRSILKRALKASRDILWALYRWKRIYGINESKTSPSRRKRAKGAALTPPRHKEKLERGPQTTYSSFHFYHNLRVDQCLAICHNLIAVSMHALLQQNQDPEDELTWPQCLEAYRLGAFLVQGSTSEDRRILGTIVRNVKRAIDTVEKRGVFHCSLSAPVLADFQRQFPRRSTPLGHDTGATVHAVLHTLDCRSNHNHLPSLPLIHPKPSKSGPFLNSNEGRQHLAPDTMVIGPCHVNNVLLMQEKTPSAPAVLASPISRRHDPLSERRRRVERSCVIIQSIVRGFVYRCRYDRAKYSIRWCQSTVRRRRAQRNYAIERGGVMLLQAVVRGQKSRRNWATMFSNFSIARRIQLCFRRYQARKIYRQRMRGLWRTLELEAVAMITRAALRMQKVFRGYKERRRLEILRECQDRERQATRIQSFYRAYLLRAQMKQVRWATLLCQSRVRGVLAKMRFCALRKQEWASIIIHDE